MRSPFERAVDGGIQITLPFQNMHRRLSLRHQPDLASLVAAAPRTVLVGQHHLDAAELATKAPEREINPASDVFTQGSGQVESQGAQLDFHGEPPVVVVDDHTFPSANTSVKSNIFRILIHYPDELETAMHTLNYRHLRYFHAVAHAGSIARASEQLHLTPHAISTQLGELEQAMGVPLFARRGRGLVLTEAGERALSFADEIFALGDNLLDAVRDATTRPARAFRVGICDVVPKSVAHRLVAPVLELPEPTRLVCREGRIEDLLAELAVQRLDVIIADRPVPGGHHVRAFHHLLGTSGLSVFGTRRLLSRLPGSFPALLDGAPLLLPGEDVATRRRLLTWLAGHRLRPRVVGEFDDSALIKAFGQAGAGLFVAPTAMADYICRQYNVAIAGELPDVREEIYLVSAARQVTHPAVLAMQTAARTQLFTQPAPQARVRARSINSRKSTPGNR